jgi:amino acid transporter
MVNARPFHVRNASGLVREFGTFDLFAFNVLGFAPGFSIVILPGVIAASYAGADVSGVLCVGFVLALFNGLTYGLLAATMPRSGGDYVFISRTIGPSVGFAASWGFFWSQVIGLGYYACLLVSDVVSPSLGLLSRFTGSARAAKWAQSVSEQPTLAVLAFLGLALVLGISLLGTRKLRHFVNAALALALLGSLVMLWVLVTSDHATFVQRFDGFVVAGGGGAGGYQAVLAFASRTAPAVGPRGLWPTLLALPVGYWVFIGFTYSAYVAGEVRSPSRSQLRGIGAALLFGLVFYLVFIHAYYNVVGRDFVRAATLAHGAPGAPPVGDGSVPFFVGLLIDHPAVGVMVGLSTVLWFAMVLVIIAQVSIRTVFAWAVDGLVPEWLRTVSTRTAAPWASAVAVLVLAGGFVLVSTVLQAPLLDYIIALFSVCFLITGLAAIVLPYRRPDIFQMAPRFAQKRLAGIPVLVLAGAGNTLLFMIVLFSAFSTPGVTGPGGLRTVAFVATIYALGYLLFLAVSRYRVRNGGFGFGEIYEELPPE